MSLPKNINPGKSNPRESELRIPATGPDEPASMTTCAIITGAGRSAISVISVRGPDAGEMVSQCFEGVSKSRFLPGEIRFGVWTRSQNDRPTDPGESVVLTPLSSDRFEIHCHGGPGATTRIIEDLKDAGATPVESDCPMPPDRLLIHEATQTLAGCLTARTAAIAMDQYRGVMSRWAIETIDALESGGAIQTEHAQREASEILRFAELGTRLAEPFRVVITGPPNVGKSSLLNAIVGYDRSIALDAAGTTRDVLHANTVIDGLPIRLSDTAGIRESCETIEKEGTVRARSAARGADLVLSVSEPNLSTPTKDEKFEIEDIQGPVIRVLNKSDLLRDDQVPHQDQIATAAISGEGVEELMAAIAENLGRAIPPPNSPVPTNDRQVTLFCEIVAAIGKDEVVGKLRQLLAVNL